MDDFEDFYVLFGGDANLAYDQKLIERIVRHRRLLDDKLFFDRLLGAVGISNTSSLYPAQSNHELQVLYESIVSASAQEHHKHSLIYYILKDLMLRNRDAETFARQVHLPERYRIFIDGIWYLDRLGIEEALSYLTEPCLIPTFPDEILYTLCKFCQHDRMIPLRYYHTVSPPLSNIKTLDAYFYHVCLSSITEAFFFARSRDATIHRYLFEQILAFVHAHSSGESRASRGTELISLPLDSEEQAWFEQYLLEGKGKKLFGAKDTIIMRYMALGQSQKAQKLARAVNERKIDNMNWTSLTQGLDDL